MTNLKSVFLLTVALLMFSVVNVFSQTLNTNLRVAQRGEEKDVTVLLYEIKIDYNTISFDCKNAPLDFTLEVEELLSIETINEFQVETFSTTEEDEIVFIYRGETLVSICVKQINDVDLLYMHSEITRSGTSNTHKL